MLAQHEHDGRDEDHAHEERVEEDGRRERHTDRLDERVVLRGERGEHRDHDERGGDDDAARVAETVDDGVACVHAVGVRLTHARGEEDLVVHREAEHDADEQRRHEAHDGLRVEPAERAVLDELHRHAERREDRGEEAQRREERHDDRTEHEHEQDEREPDDDGEVRRERVVELLRHVCGDRRLAGDADLDVARLLDVGLTVAQARQQVVGLLVGGARLRRDHDDGAVTLLRHLDDLRVGDVVLLRRPLHDLAVRLHLLAGEFLLRRGVRAGDLDVTSVEYGDHRGVLARAEALGEQVGALTRLGVLLRRGVGGQAEVQVAHGCREHAQKGDDAERDGPRSLADAATESDRTVDEVVVGVVGGRVLAHPPTERLALEHAHESGQQRQADHDGDEDGARGAETHRRQHADAEHRECGQRDEDGETGEHDGRAGRPEGTTHRVGTLVVLRPVDVPQLAAVTRQDEQRVVDADGETDHRRERRRRLRQVEEVRRTRDAERAQQQPDDGVEDRHARRDERTERDDEDDERDGDADELRGAAGLHHLLHALTAGDDRQTVLRLGRGIRTDLLLRVLLDVHDVLDIEVPRDRADAPVLRQRRQGLGVRLGLLLRHALLHRLRDELLALHLRGDDGVRDGLRLSALRHLRCALQLLDERVDLALVRLLGERVARRRLQDDLAVDLLVGSLGVGEELLLHLGRLERRDAGDGELAGHRLALGGGETTDREDRDEPADEEERPLLVSRPPEAVEDVCHEDLLASGGWTKDARRSASRWW